MSDELKAMILKQALHFRLFKWVYMMMSHRIHHRNCRTESLSSWEIKPLPELVAQLSLRDPTAQIYGVHLVGGQAENMQNQWNISACNGSQDCCSTTASQYSTVLMCHSVQMSPSFFSPRIQDFPGVSANIPWFSVAVRMTAPTSPQTSQTPTPTPWIACADFAVPVELRPSNVRWCWDTFQSALTASWQCQAPLTETTPRNPFVKDHGSWLSGQPTALAHNFKMRFHSCGGRCQILVTASSKSSSLPTPMISRDLSLAPLASPSLKKPSTISGPAKRDVCKFEWLAGPN